MAVETRAASGDEEEALVAARALVPWGDGFLALIETVSAAGTTRSSVEAVGPDGSARPVPGGDEGREGDRTGTFASLDLAALAVPALGPAGREAIKAALRDGAAQVAVDAGAVAVLDAMPDAFDGTRQQILRGVVPALGAAGLRALDLGPLRLSARRAVTGLAVQAGWIYAFVADPVRGFEVLRASATDAEGAFEPLLSEGAWRFALNGTVSAAAAHPEGLLLGTAALAHSAAEVGSWGPEVILLRADGTWDLVFGQPRFTPAGLKRSLSGQLPGLGSPANAAVKAIVAGAPGRGGATILVQDFAGEAVEDRSGAAPDLFDYAGEARVLRSGDLRRWDEAPLDWPEGLGAASALGVSAGGVLVGHESLAGDRPPMTFLPFR